MAMLDPGPPSLLLNICMRTSRKRLQKVDYIGKYAHCALVNKYILTQMLNISVDTILYCYV